MNYAIVFAGGNGVRMKSPVPKQFIEVSGKPILIHTVELFERHKEIDGICVVCVADWCGRLLKMLKQYGIQKVKWVVEGGPTGQQSIYNGLKAIEENEISPEAIVLIHDGVRPFVSENVISECIDCVKQHGSAITVCPVPETIVQVDDYGNITDIPIRSRCYLSKAPQGFYLRQLIEAHRRAISENRFDCTNSAELMRRYGHKLHVIYDTEKNIKVTTPVDIALMETLLQKGVG